MTQAPMIERNLGSVNRADLEQAFQEHALVFMVEIAHPDMDGIVRLAGDGEDYVIDGKTWHKGWFELALLSDSTGTPKTEFSFPNIDRQKTALLEKVTNPAKVSFTLYSTAAFDLNVVPRVVKTGATLTPLYAALELDLVKVNLGASQVTGQLISFDPSAYNWPAVRTTQSLAPGAGFQ